jgi:hypothetical protein
MDAEELIRRAGVGYLDRKDLIWASDGSREEGVAAEVVLSRVAPPSNELPPLDDDVDEADLVEEIDPQQEAVPTAAPIKGPDWLSDVEPARRTPPAATKVPEWVRELAAFQEAQLRARRAAGAAPPDWVENVRRVEEPKRPKAAP